MLKIYNHQKLVSTSVTALLRSEAEKKTFAIIALEQSKGRGRLGSQWQSPKGGIYLSIVLPFLTKDPRLYASHSIFVAILIHQWLKKTFAFEVTVKWPNDLLWQGKKVGGILCESLKDNRVSVGIGLNFKELPLEKNIKTAFIEKISLKNISTEYVNITAYARSLANFVYQEWGADLFADTMQCYQKLSTIDLWENSRSDVFLSQGLDRCGHLVLRDQSQNMVLESSVRNDFVPIDKEDKRIAWVDIGHTNTKVKTFKKTYVFPNGTLEDNFFAPVLEDVPDPICVVMSVDEQIKSRVFQIFYALNLPVVETPKRTRRLCTDYDLSALGVDRLAHMEAVLGKLSLDKSLDLAMVVSLGTANVVDVVDREGNHLGGWILPGLEFSMKSLHSMMGLPYERKVLTTHQPFLLGKSTDFCVASGLKNSFVYALEALKLRLLKSTGAKKCAVFITGGNAMNYSFSEDCFVTNDLSFEGMKILF